MAYRDTGPWDHIQSDDFKPVSIEGGVSSVLFIIKNAARYMERLQAQITIPSNILPVSHILVIVYISSLKFLLIRMNMVIWLLVKWHRPSYLSLLRIH